MKGVRNLILNALAIVVLAVPACAATRTVTLKVSGMTCAMCPITVKKALERVPGVTKIAVSFEKKEAVVTFDDAKANTNALVKATTDAGYPSKVEKTSK